MSVVAHVGATTTPLPVRFGIAVLAGLCAAAVANLPVSYLAHGDAPLRVVAAELWNESTEEVPGSAVAAVHYAGGMVAGALFEASVVALEGVVPDRTLAHLLTSFRRAIPDVTAAAATITWGEVVAAGFVVAAAYLAVVEWPLPLYSEYEDDEARAAVERQWAASLVVFGVALVLLVPVLYAVLPV